MPRIAREVLFKESKVFHILVQGINKEYIFDEPKFKLFYLKTLKEKCDLFNVSILAFCMMGNHAHLILTAKDTSKISKVLAKTNTTYGRYYNKEKKRVGFVFRNRFRSEALIDEKYLINCIGYIHNNPVKAKICEIAENYSYSSAKNFQTKDGIVDFKKLKEILGIIPKSFEEGKGFADENEFENFDDVLSEIVKKKNIQSKNMLKNSSVLKEIVLELKQRTGVSLREIADRLEIGRETVRKTCQ